MAKLESKKLEINSTAAEIYTFLSDLNNLEQLMPSEKIEGWKSTEEECSFNIKGLSKIGMKRAGGNANSLINLVSEGKNPFDFTLDIHIEENGSTAFGQIKFEGKMNPFIKAMVEKPLTNFFNMLVEKLQEIKA